MGKILQWNCNGIKAHYSDLKTVIIQQDPLCICIQETHLIPHEQFHLKGFVSVTKEVCPDERAKGGVAIFLKENISFKVVPIQTRLQAVAIETYLPSKMTICNIYLPDFNWNVDDIRQIIHQLPSPFILAGDFNSHNPLWGSTRKDVRGKIIETIIDEFNLVILNTGEGTYLNNRSHNFTCIDLTICSPSLTTKLHWKTLEDSLFSNHIPILIQYISQEIKPINKRRWIIERADWTTFRNLMNPIDISEDINEAVNRLTYLINNIAEKSIPQSRGSSVKSIPWWNNEVQSAIKAKKRALNKFKKHPSQENMIFFKRCRAKARRIIITSKRESWKNYVSQITRDTPLKEVWEKVRRISRTSNNSPLPMIQKGNELLTNTIDIVEELALYFETVSSTANYNSNFIEIKSLEETEINFHTNDNLSYNDPFNLLELDKALQDSGSSCPGPDNIHYEMLRQLPENIKQILLNIYNKIWLNSTYPEKWREANVIPLLKPNKDPKLTSSYRPISLTCCTSKILEKMVNLRLIWYLEREKLLSNFQMGFRKNRSTTDAMIYLENAIQNSFFHRNHLVAIFFDMEKAYDTTWRYGILKQLYSWRMKGNLPNFIKSFMSHRSFKVALQDTTSHIHNLENGVPQGSNLSVTLFAIAINDLLESIPPNVGYSLYVDDLTIFYSANSMTEIETTLQKTIDDIVNKAERKGFRFSQTKTESVHFCRRRKPHNDPHLTIKGNSIECKPSKKFLGLIFDRKLRWTEHIDDLVIRCKKALNIMRCLAGINWGADKEVLSSLYTSLVLSKIDYGSAVYSSARHTRLRILDTVHCTGLRLITGAFRTSPLSSLCCETSISPLKHRRERFLLSYAVKIWAQPSHPNYELIFNEEQRERFSTRSTITRPAGIRVHETIDAEFPEILPLLSCEAPPWKIPVPKCHLECTVFSKKEYNKRLIKNIFEEIIQRYSNATIIYTDGSKMDQGVGSAFVAENKTHSWRLDYRASIYTAELYAIWQAMLYSNMNKRRTFVICSDSLSAISAIENTFSKDPMIQQILCLYLHLYNMGKQIIFVWIPSHIGISGNEAADSAARNAAKKDIDHGTIIRPDDLSVWIKNKALDSWQTDWNNTDSKLKFVKPMISKWVLPRQISRREQVIITRLRIGHTKLTSCYLLLREQQPMCDQCTELLTVKHIILNCKKYHYIRNQLNLPKNIKECLTNEPERITILLEFIKRAGLWRLI